MFGCLVKYYEFCQNVALLVPPVVYEVSNCWFLSCAFLFFYSELQRGATIVYATHIFDGLETWATHLAYIQDGELRRAEKLSEIDGLKNSANLLSVVESWLRSEIKEEKKKPVNPPAQNQKSSPSGTSPFVSSRHMAYYRWFLEQAIEDKSQIQIHKWEELINWSTSFVVCGSYCLNLGVIILVMW